MFVRRRTRDGFDYKYSIRNDSNSLDQHRNDEYQHDKLSKKIRCLESITSQLEYHTEALYSPEEFANDGSLEGIDQTKLQTSNDKR